MENKKGIPALRIREYRLKAGLSQNALAKKAGVSQSHISELESGEKKVGLAIAQKLAGALNCSLMEMLPGDEEDQTAETFEESESNQ